MGGVSVALLLIACAVGYKVMVRAEETGKEYLKKTGRILGVVIITVSLISIGCALYKIHALKGCSWSTFTCPYKTAGK